MTNVAAITLPQLHNPPQGFTVVPTDIYFAVNEEGQVWNLRSNILCKQSNGPGGYKTVGINWGGKIVSRYVHRLVASALLPIPDHLAGERLEVNHIVRDKENNKLSNLEWVTAKMNIRHLYLTKGFDGRTLSAKTANSSIYSTRIQVRNVKSGKVMEYPTLHYVVDMFNVDKDRMKRHLISDKAGLLTKNWCVFRLATEKDNPWPVIPPEDMVENRWDLPDGFWIVRKEDSPEFLFTAEKMPALAEFFSIPLHILQYNVKNDGKEYACRGYVFKHLSYPNADQMKHAPKPAERSGYKPPKRMMVTTVETGAVVIYKSGKEASRETGIAESSINMAIKKKNGHHKGLLFQYVD